MDQASSEVLPPTAAADVNRAAGSAVALAAVAAAAGLVVAAVHDPAGPASGVVEKLNTVRLVLVGFAALAGGWATAVRPDLARGWLAAAAVAVLAGTVALPAHWDSARLLARVVAAVALAGGALSAVPFVWRAAAVSAVVLFHFGGILVATTWPDPTPWLTAQLGSRVYTPYLTFLYLKNAYHFYSPEPGPASHLFCLVTYELDDLDAKGNKKTESGWVTLPRRDQHMKDPLGLTYYRRLSITEMVSQTYPDFMTPESFEKSEAKARRMDAAFGTAGKEPIPVVADVEPMYSQYRMPRADISRYLLPSYASHLAAEYSAPGRRVRTVKLYRVEHRIMAPAQFQAGGSPHHPMTYRPYFVGEYKPDGELVDPQDPMLYWLVPIAPKPGGAAPDDPERRDFIDHLSRHAGFEFDWRSLRP